MPGPVYITDSNLTGVLKNVYANFRVNTFPLLTPLLANIKRGQAGGPEKMRFGGNGVFWDVVVDRPTGWTASPGGFFPPSSVAPEVQANLGIKRTYVTRQVDALAIMATEAREAAYIPLAKKIVQEAVDTGRLAQQEILHGDGNGIKGIVSSVTNSTTFVISNPYGVSGTTLGQGGLLLAKNMYVAFRSTGGTTLRGKATILTVSNSGDAATITVDTAIASVVSTDIIIAATTSDDAYGNVPYGLIAVTNRGTSYGTFEGVSGGPSGTYTRWDATHMVAGTDTSDATQVSELDIWQLAAVVAGKSGKDATVNPGQFLLMTTPGMKRNLAQTFLGQRRFDAAEMMEIQGGFKAVSIAGIPLISDPWCPAGTIYLIHLPTMTWVDLLDWVKLSYEGSGPWRFIPGQDAYELDFGSYWNFGALQRNSHGSIAGYVDTTRYTFVM